MRWVVGVVGCAAFLLNPWLACGGDPADDFRYGDVEMRAAAVGTWNVELALTGGGSSAITIRIEQSSTAPQALRAAPPVTGPARPWVRSAAACGKRTLLRSASACISVTSMPLAGAFLAGDSTYSGAVIDGDLTVAGLLFVTGELSLSLGDKGRITAQLSSDGHASGATLWAPSGAVLGTATLVRTGP